jgi:hypothetical protein
MAAAAARARKSLEAEQIAGRRISFLRGGSLWLFRPFFFFAAHTHI